MRRTSVVTQYDDEPDAKSLIKISKPDVDLSQEERSSVSSNDENDDNNNQQLNNKIQNYEGPIDGILHPKSKKFPAVLKVDGKAYSTDNLSNALDKCDKEPKCKGVTLRKLKKIKTSTICV